MIPRSRLSKHILTQLQVAVERTKPTGRIVGIDIIPAQPPKGVSTFQGNFLSAGVQAEVKRFLSDPAQGRPKKQIFSVFDEPNGEDSRTLISEEDESYIDHERHMDEEDSPAPNLVRRIGRKDYDGPERMVDVVLSDMSEPWPQTTGFWKRTLSDPYIRMMNTSGINFKDHTGSMVWLHPSCAGFLVDHESRIFVPRRCSLPVILFAWEDILYASSTKDRRTRSWKGNSGLCSGLFIGRSPNRHGV